mgnify:CR=1 FL=1
MESAGVCPVTLSGGKREEAYAAPRTIGSGGGERGPLTSDRGGEIRAGPRRIPPTPTASPKKPAGSTEHCVNAQHASEASR